MTKYLYLLKYSSGIFTVVFTILALLAMVIAYPLKSIDPIDPVISNYGGYPPTAFVFNLLTILIGLVLMIYNYQYAQVVFPKSKWKLAAVIPAIGVIGIGLIPVPFDLSLIVQRAGHWAFALVMLYGYPILMLVSEQHIHRWGLSISRFSTAAALIIFATSFAALVLTNLDKLLIEVIALCAIGAWIFITNIYVLLEKKNSPGA